MSYFDISCIQIVKTTSKQLKGKYYIIILEPALCNEFFQIPVLHVRKLLEWIHAHIMTIYIYMLNKILISGGINFDLPLFLISRVSMLLYSIIIVKLFICL